MRSLFQVLLLSVGLIAGCGPATPTAPAPTNPPPPPTVPSASSAASPSPVAKPASPAPSPAGASASPAAGAVASPSAGPAVNAPVLASGSPTPGFVLQSSAFPAGGNLPTQFSCDAPGGGQSPPLSWSGAPAAARVFALVDQDPDAGAGGNAFTHWVVFNIPATVSQLDAGQPAQDTLPSGALQGQNGRRVTAYQGACPPAGSPAHHYTFQLFALDGPLPLQAGASIVDLQRAMTGHIVGQTQLVALFGH